MCVYMFRYRRGRPGVICLVIPNLSPPSQPPRRTKVITLDFPASAPLSQCATSRAEQQKEKHRYLGTWTLFAEYSWVVSGCKDARCREQLLGRTLYARDVSAVLPRVDQSLRAALKFDFRRRFACPRSRFHTRPLWHRRAS